MLILLPQKKKEFWLTFTVLRYVVNQTLRESGLAGGRCGKVSGALRLDVQLMHLGLVVTFKNFKIKWKRVL
jgi:hypothetical protein